MKKIVIDILTQLHKEGSTIIVVTHDLEVGDVAERKNNIRIWKNCRCYRSKTIWKEKIILIIVFLKYKYLIFLILYIRLLDSL